MNYIVDNSINSYTYDSISSTVTSTETTDDDTLSTNSTEEISNSDSDTIEITSDSNNYSAYLKTIDEVSSESDLISCEGGSATLQVEFFLTAKAMEHFGYTIPSIDNTCSSYSNFIDEMKDFVSSYSNLSNSDELISFCDTLKERLNSYGIN